MNNFKKYPIKAVSQITGLTAFVIRAWEKRYSLINPERTETNRRLYSDEDIEKLILLKNATNMGHNIGLIANYSSKQLKDIIRSSETEVTPDSSLDKFLLDDDFKEIIYDAISAVKNLDSNKLESILLRASVNFSQPNLFDKILIPLIYIIGEHWQTGELRIYNEHFASSIIKKFLYGIMDSNSAFEEIPSIVVTTPKGQLHELGAMIYGAIAASDGWRVSYLGSNLPAEEIGAAALQVNANVVCLGIIYPKDDPFLSRELEKLRNILGNEILIIAGGQAVDNYREALNKINAYISYNSEALRAKLNSLRGN